MSDTDIATGIIWLIMAGGFFAVGWLLYLGFSKIPAVARWLAYDEIKKELKAGKTIREIKVDKLR